jgi:hypothetical protein
LCGYYKLLEKLYRRRRAFGTTLGSLETAHEQVVARNQTLVDGFAERVVKGGLVVQATVKEGDPGKLIVKEAIDWGART